METKETKTCETCKNFIGGGDWGLCCKDPPKSQISWCGFLCYEDTPACENYKEEDNNYGIKGND